MVKSLKQEKELLYVIDNTYVDLRDMIIGHKLKLFQEDSKEDYQFDDFTLCEIIY